MGNNLEKIDQFRSPQEFLRFENWIAGEIGSGAASETPVLHYFAGENFQERWFEFHSANEVWRLVYPDGPFKGYWGKVEA
jgi:hypothetical protein